MFESLIRDKVTVDVTEGGGKLLQYVGILVSESDDAIELSNVDIFYLTKVFINSWSREELQKYKSGLNKVIINKRYVISCDK